ncbi:unnamed protein product [Auanema sp. JU1783]|nr:unnamed protein product [Auanema sp. JU1783]
MVAAQLLRSTSIRILNHSRYINNSRALYLPIVQFKLSDIGEGIAEVQVKEWYVKEGDTVSQFDNLCDVQSDKAAVTITSRYDGVIRKLYHNIDDLARVGLPLVDIEIEGDDSEESTKDSEKTQTSSATQTASGHHGTQGKVLATPAVRRIAMENKVNLSAVPATGKEGRVLKEDILKFLGHVKSDHSSGSKNVRASPATGGSQAQASYKTYEPLREDTAVPIRGYTRAMVKTMTEALKVPHFGYYDEITMDALMRVRGELKDFAKEQGLKLSFMPFFIKAASLALLEFPSLNATVDDKLENLVYKASHNICLAMDTPGGLVVPNIKNCEQRSVFEISAELLRLQEAGKNQNIRTEDLVGGTFTLSNIGAIGGTYASPVVFPPQVAIGAIGRVQKVPRFDRHDNVVAAHVMNVSWSADHRVVDGATMARFGNRWKYYLEHPSAMLAQLK